MNFRHGIVREAWGRRIIPVVLQSSSRFRPAYSFFSRKKARTIVTAATNTTIVPITTLPPPSVAQSHAISILQNTQRNILINACAGSGKTTTILQLAAAMPAHDFLILVYNKRLMMETNERIGNLGLKNAVVYNYHTLGHRFYVAECDTDQGLKRVVHDKLPVIRGKKLPECDVIVLDEQQDMTPILKVFIDKVLRDIEHLRHARKAKTSKKGTAEEKGQMEDLMSLGDLARAGGGQSQIRRVLLGDPRQELYEFNDSDRRFLTIAHLPELFGNGEEWEPIKQKISYRLTAQNADFINKQLLKKEPGEEIVAIKDKSVDETPYPRPRYVFFKALGSEDDIFSYIPYLEVLRLLSKGVKYTDILILAPSLKSRPFIQLVNYLALARIPVQAPDHEDSHETSPSITKGKISVCTYHKSKGIEREAAILFGFDASYHLYYNRNPDNPEVASNPQYVAATRAKTDLVLLHGVHFGYLPFIDPETLEETCDVVGSLAQDHTSFDGGTPVACSMTTLIRNVRQRDMSACIQELNLEQIAPGYQAGSPATEIEIGEGLVEGVADITGTAVTAMYEYYAKGKRYSLRTGSFCQLFKDFANYNENYNKGRRLPKALRLFSLLHQYRPEYLEKLRETEQKLIEHSAGDGDFLFLANFWMAIESGVLVKLLSIPLDRYTWFEPKHRMNLIRKLHERIPPGCRYEQGISHVFTGIERPGDSTPINVRVDGRFDMVRFDEDNRCIWEVKYTQKTKIEHILQLAIYAGLMEAKYGPGTYKLVNALSGQVIEVKPKTEKSFDNIIRGLIKAKTNKSDTLAERLKEEEQFVKEAGEGFKNFIGPVVLPSWFNDKKLSRLSQPRAKSPRKGAAKKASKTTAKAAAEKTI